MEDKITEYLSTNFKKMENQTYVGCITIGNILKMWIMVKNSESGFEGLKLKKFIPRRCYFPVFVYFFLHFYDIIKFYILIMALFLFLESHLFMPYNQRKTKGTCKHE